MFTRLSKFAAVLSGVTASLMITSTAMAQEPVVVRAQPLEGARTEHVSYADLDLAAFPAQRKLQLRVASAVKRVCLYHDNLGLQDADYSACADGAWNGAAPQIAQAIQRAREMALNGKSSIAAAAITISVK